MQVRHFHEDIESMSPVANQSDNSFDSDSSPKASAASKQRLMVSFGQNLTVQTKNLKKMKAGESSKSPSPQPKKINS